MRVFHCEQTSDEWWALRRGVPTASEFHRIITPKTGKLSAQAEGYCNRLIGDTLDRLYPRKEGFANSAIRHGVEQEPEARNAYEFLFDATVDRVGFVTTDDGRFGCSPDGLVGADGGIQLKNPTPQVHVEYLFGNCLPDEYRCQVHGELLVTGRKWWDFVSYCPGLPEFVCRVKPDEFTEKLREALESFWTLYQTRLMTVRNLLGREREQAA